MRRWMKLVEGLLPTLYHGSRKNFPVGFVLTPQNDGYIDAERDNAAHAMLEELLEKYRPEHCLSRRSAVFMVADPEEIDYAGGYNDHVYVVEPSGPVTRCNLAWYSELYLHCEHETLSAEIASQRGHDWYPDWEDPEAKEYALNYWNAVTAPDPSHDLYEFLAPSAVITERK